MSKDGLSEQEQKSAVPLLTETFAGEGEETTDAPCEDVYTVYHLKLGHAVTVVVSGAKGKRKLRVKSLEDVSSAYSQIVRALIAGTEIIAEDTRTRKNVTDDQADPNRVKADNLVYISLGGGTSMRGTDSPLLDVGYAFGYRYELDELGLDISFRIQAARKDRRDEYDRRIRETTALSGNLRGLYFLNPAGTSTFYVGGGMSYGNIEFYRDDKEFSGTGLMANGVVGYEIWRASTIRMFFQAATFLPFFEAPRISEPFSSNPEDNSRWVPQVMFTIGGVWTKLTGGGCCF